MANETAIEWTDLTWNPVHGCSIVSTECRNCYAQELSLRRKLTHKPWTPANAGSRSLCGFRRTFSALSNGKDWQGLGAAAAKAGKTDGKLVFVNSTSDLFHEQVPFEFIDRVFETMVEAERHTFQILTKRPERMLEYFDYVADYMGLVRADLIPWPNVWLGVSIGLRHFVGRADVLREVPAAVRFISAEPLLGPLVGRWTELRGDYGASHGWEHVWPDGRTEGDPLDLVGIDWLIAGGESGAKHRPLDLDWVRDLRDAACLARTVFLFKQVGGHTPKAGGRELDGRTWDEFPQVEVHAA